MDLGLKDKVALVTGGGAGINRVVCLTFAQEGANVAVCDLPPGPESDHKWASVALNLGEKATAADVFGKERMEQMHGLSRGEFVAEECRQLGVKAMFAPADVTNQEQVNAMVQKVIGEMGHIDILVNGAGGQRFAGPFATTKKEDWEFTVNLCLFGMMNCTRAVLPHMIEKRYGKICSVLSDAMKGNDQGQAVYGGAKAAISSLSRTLANENGRYGINFNCVAPGATVTEATEAMGKLRQGGMSPEDAEQLRKRMLNAYALGRFYNGTGKPEDLANMIVFLCSERARWVTGQSISVSGGYHMAPL